MVEYSNGVFSILLAVFIYFRISHALIFDRGVHNISIITETILMILFLVALITDVIQIQLDSIFTVVLILIVLCSVLFVMQMKSKLRESFLTKIDIFNYSEEQDALLMMISLHELIEMSTVREREEFLLRGFVERHIEICDFPDCNCIDYYKIINSSYRLSLATYATMKEEETKRDFEQKSINRTIDD